MYIIYTYIYIYTYTYLYTHIHTNVKINLRTFTSLHNSSRYVSTHLSISEYVHRYIIQLRSEYILHFFSCMYVYTCLYLYPHIHIHIHKYLCTCICIYDLDSNSYAYISTTYMYICDIHIHICAFTNIQHRESIESRRDNIMYLLKAPDPRKGIMHTCAHVHILESCKNIHT